MTPEQREIINYNIGKLDGITVMTRIVEDADVSEALDNIIEDLLNMLEKDARLGARPIEPKFEDHKKAKNADKQEEHLLVLSTNMTSYVGIDIDQIDQIVDEGFGSIVIMNDGKKFEVNEKKDVIKGLIELVKSGKLKQDIEKLKEYWNGRNL